MLNLTRKNSGSSHSYKIDGLWAPGATTVIDACSPKRLDGWAARLAAAHADEHWERLSTMRSADRIAEIETQMVASGQATLVDSLKLFARHQAEIRSQRGQLTDEMRLAWKYDLDTTRREREDTYPN